MLTSSQPSAKQDMVDEQKAVMDRLTSLQLTQADELKQINSKMAVCLSSQVCSHDLYHHCSFHPAMVNDTSIRSSPFYFLGQRLVNPVMANHAYASCR